MDDPASDMYQYHGITRSGLDVLIKAYMSQLESLFMAPKSAATIDSDTFTALWNTGQTDTEGG